MTSSVIQSAGFRVFRLQWETFLASLEGESRGGFTVS